MHPGRNTRYVIECRDESGKLDFTKPQPEDVFGMRAIHGISEDGMAREVWRVKGDDVVLTGSNLLAWPSFIDPRWRARVKTW